MLDDTVSGTILNDIAGSAAQLGKGLFGGNQERDLSPIEWVPGKGWRRSYTNAQGERVTRGLNTNEFTSISENPGSQATKIEGEKADKLTADTRAEAAEIQRESTRRFEASHALTAAQIKSAITNSEGQLKILGGQIAQQGANAENTHQLALLAYKQQGEQNNRNSLLQTLALNNADRTANRRLDIQENLATQQQAENKSERKLRAIMGISESLAQLRI